jgi:tetraacyldisaccharide 4'-kinase
LRIDGIYVLYRVLGWIGLPFILLYLLLRGLKDRRYFHLIGQRFGCLPREYRQTHGGAIWLHAVSVGEVMCSVELLRGLRSRFPLARLFVSTTTLAGKAIADQKLRGLADGVFYAPIDYCFAVRRVLRTLRPRVVVVLETEIWPNLYREAKRAGCGLLIVNGRISDRAAGRYFKFRRVFRAVLQWPDRILAQNEIGRTRFIAAGAAAEKVEVAGNLKYDFDPTKTGAPAVVRGFLRTAGPSHVWIAASTMPPAHADDVDEDDAVIAAFQKLALRRAGLLLILVPRKPERFDTAAQKLGRAGVHFLRRSSLTATSRLELPGVLLVDTMGELSGLFSLADVVFMGGTLAERGGHNILEPAFFGCAIVAGPHMENFPDIAMEFSAARAYVEIPSAGELDGAVGAILDGKQLRMDLGRRAFALAGARRGATARAIEHIGRLLTAPLAVRPRPLLDFLSRAWEFGSHWKRKKDLANCRRLSTPVIGVGGIAMGGTGKTPFVAWLAERLSEAGFGPGILTRGYRRRSREKVTLLEAGAAAPPALTGDEPRILLRTKAAPLGIGRDRFETGRAMEERFQCGVFLLDDGFQHWRLARDLDIVLIDALDPFGGGGVFPLGRLREPLEALARAGIFVIAHAEAGRSYDEIVSVLREHNSRAPVFTSRVAPQCWVDVATGEQFQAGDPPFLAAAAFCGLANPDSFRRTLAALNIRPVREFTFRDHHRYSAREVRRMAASAGALITTEKDAANLPEDWRDAIRPARLFELRIGIEVDGATSLLGLIRERIAAPGPPTAARP